MTAKQDNDSEGGRDVVLEVEELLAKATPGSWRFDGYCYIFAKQPDGNCHPMIADFDTDEAYLTRMRGVGAGLVENGQQEANARLIAAAPNPLRRMVEEVKRLRLKVDAITGSRIRDLVGDDHDD